jgi:hypothetical protein
MKNPHGGFYYEINRDYPMVQQIIGQTSGVQPMLDALLKQIEINLPLNQLYVDLNNDEQLTNDKEQSENDIIAALRSMLTDQMSIEEKLAFLNVMETIEPFVQYPDAVEKLKKEVTADA